jgi:1,4-dihydroxy-6-naphthoate synthase
VNTYSLAISPCPNDTFIFHAMLHGLVDTEEFNFQCHLGDVEELNQSAIKGTHDITKLSYHAMLYLQDSYRVLSAGAALGFGCGPLVVSKGDVILEKAVIAIPGQYTTANLLLHLWAPLVKDVRIMKFDQIMPAVVQGDVDAGVIIHEGRFVYPQYGLKKIVDLGQWWESETKLPIPLGCIAVKKSIDMSISERVSSFIKESILYGRSHKEASRSYIKNHSQEMDDDVIDEHIGLYVNDYSLDTGDVGARAFE